MAYQTSWAILWHRRTNSCENKAVNTFTEGISPKVNVIAWLEFELLYQDVVSPAR